MSKALVLIVDDEAFHRYTTRMMLQQAGFDVKEASTGRDALRQAEEHPDVVLLDLHLPDLSGIEICRQLKQTPSTAAIRVVHVTAAYLGSAERREALEAGSDGYLIRPIDTPQLMATIKAVLTRRAA